MRKKRNNTVTTIPVRLSLPELNVLKKVRGILNATAYSRAFISALNELIYLIDEKRKLEEDNRRLFAEVEALKALVSGMQLEYEVKNNLLINHSENGDANDI